MELVLLAIGDRWGDGHGKWGFCLIKSSLSEEGIKVAYAAGCEVIGFNLSEDELAGYEESELSDEAKEKLEAQGFSVSDDILTNNEFAAIYLQIARLGNSDFAWETVEVPCIDIGGYGLFD